MIPVRNKERTSACIAQHLPFPAAPSCLLICRHHHIAQAGQWQALPGGLACIARRHLWLGPPAMWKLVLGCMGGADSVDALAEARADCIRGVCMGASELRLALAAAVKICSGGGVCTLSTTALYTPSFPS